MAVYGSHSPNQLGGRNSKQAVCLSLTHLMLLVEASVIPPEAPPFTANSVNVVAHAGCLPARKLARRTAFTSRARNYAAYAGLARRQGIRDDSLATGQHRLGEGKGAEELHGSTSRTISR